MVIIGACKSMHKIIFENYPIALMQYITHSRINIDGTRSVRKGNLKRVPLTEKNKEIFFP